MNWKSIILTCMIAVFIFIFIMSVKYREGLSAKQKKLAINSAININNSTNRTLTVMSDSIYNTLNPNKPRRLTKMVASKHKKKRRNILKSVKKGFSKAGKAAGKAISKGFSKFGSLFKRKRKRKQKR